LSFSARSVFGEGASNREEESAFFLDFRKLGLARTGRNGKQEHRSNTLRELMAQ